MADIQKNLRPSTGKTWEKEFEAVDKTTKAYRDLLDEFTKYVESQRDFSNEGIDQFTTFLKNLDDVKDHWDDINDSIITNSRSIEPFLGSAATVRDIFRDIVQESSTLGRQINERYNLARKVRDVAGDMSRIYQTEEGLTKKILDQHIRKSEAVRYAWESQIRNITGLREDQAITSDLLQEYRAKEKSNIRILEIQKRRLEGADRLSATEARRLRDIRTELILRTQNLELLTTENKNAVEGLEQIARKRKELYEKYGYQRGEVSVAAKALSKIDPTAGEKLQRSYNKFLSNKVEGWEKYNKAEDIKKAAQRRVDELGPVNEKELRRNLVTGQYQNVGQIRTAREEQQTKVQELLTAIQTNEQERKKTSSYLRRNELQKEHGQLVARLRTAEGDLVKLTDSLGENALERLEAQEELNKATKDFKKISDDTLEVRTKEFGVVKSITTSLKSSLSPTKLLGGLAAAFVTALLAGLTKVDELGVQLRHRTGTWEHSMAAVNSQFATAADWLEMAVGLADKWHISPQVIFTSAEIGKMAEAKNLMGLTADEAQNLGVYAKITGTSADAYRKSIAAGFQEYSKNNRSAVSLGATQKEVLSTSDSIRLSLGGSGKRIAEAANAALSLGTNLQGVENIAKNLMNFESSIEAEMQAQLLTGKQLNLAKAREYALNNDLAGVANEIKRQGIDSAWWGRSNYIQQENMAKALGMSREEMAKMLIQQEMANGASSEMLAKNMKITEEEVKAATMADTWKKSIAELAQAVLPIVQAVRPFVEIVGVIVSKLSSLVGWIFSLGGLLDRINEKTSKWIQTIGKVVLAWPIIGRVTGAFFTGLTGYVTKAAASFGSLKSAAIGAFAFMKNPKAGVQNLKTSLKSKLQEVAAGDSAAKTGNLSQTVSETAKAQETASRVRTGARQGPLTRLGKDIKGFFNQLAGIKWGGIAKAAAGIGLMVGSLALFGVVLRLFKDLEWSTVLKGLTSLGALTVAFIGLGLIMKSGVGAVAILAGAAAMVVMAGAVAVLGLAIKQFEGVKLADIGTMAAAMVALGGIAALAGLVAPELVIGATALTFAAGLMVIAFGAISETLDRFAKSVRKLTLVSGDELQGVAVGIRAIAGAVGELGSKLNNLEVRKLNALGKAFRRLKGANIQVQLPEQETVATVKASETETSKEIQGNRKENIEAAVQTITIKQAQVQASAQQISVEQKAADLSKIEQKMDRLEKAINSLPRIMDWDEFNRAQRANG